jgi:hypothetical protein
MQEILVYTSVAIAVFYLAAKTFFKRKKIKDGCDGCG